MSSSSPPDPAPQLDLADIQEDELEVEREHERALGVERGRRKERGGGWVTFLWALPGFIWLGFFLIAPLVFIVLMSFWTPDAAKGFVRTGLEFGKGTVRRVEVILSNGSTRIGSCWAFPGPPSTSCLGHPLDDNRIFQLRGTLLN